MTDNRVRLSDLPPLEQWLYYFRTNWKHRHDPSPYWRRIHRHFARKAISQLRFYTNRPTKKRNVPCHYGHQNMGGNNATSAEGLPG
jgi:hypothetical protein